MQDEVGVKRKLGEIQDEVLYPGVNSVNTFNTKVFRLPTRTVNLELMLGLPSKEGLTISSEISILYRINPEQAPEILRQIGPNYEQSLILPVFRSASADVCARYFAKDMHSAQRSAIEQAIAARMMEVVEERGFVIESVLMKSISLPPGLARAIEMKLEAEQESQRMQFVLQQERQEADRRIIAAEADRQIVQIQAEGRRDAKLIDAGATAEATKIEAAGTQEANEMLSDSLDARVLEFLGIEAFRELAQSPNTKVVITDGEGMLLDTR
ncbi:membrane protease subunit, SPFH domain/band 7 family protein [Plesiocystis pacifica SIR-1]|uniref:Membrane protease subunit, SPFH domain/band 7 family protein n=1 Tax=Plesiocystis pacifica SIR-1 TaxID=391625 RepID=A6G5X5_9BACT|nr:prohibitin family protein [Plesiocystis pacifica]EDM78749.1 membrane protease subunit, SPFH domain/band 7 family protein [Plesiocystis pacifica SIR-1]